MLIGVVPISNTSFTFKLPDSDQTNEQLRSANSRHFFVTVFSNDGGRNYTPLLRAKAINPRPYNIHDHQPTSDVF